MGQRKSKMSKNSYDVPPTSNGDPQRIHTPPTEAANNGFDPRVIIPQKSVVVPEVVEQSTPKPDVAEVDCKLVPTWINEEQFVDVLRQQVEGFDRITKFNVKPALAPGENYATLMLRVDIDVQLKDNSSQHVSYMLKVAHDTEQMRQMLAVINLFDIENDTYFDIIPDLEEMYKSAGREITFAAKGIRFITDPGHHHVLLEDLRPHGFKNSNRLLGLNMEHTKAALKKLAQFHAATACRVAIKGPYSPIFMDPFDAFKAARPIIDGMIGGFKTQFLESLSTYKDGDMYYDLLKPQLEKLADEWISNIQYNPDEFNVLNHGDCWSNNILFKYSDDGKIADTLFVDFQQPSFGSPARDLYYFILSSVNIDIKIKHFDFFMRYYFNHLTESLKLLKYPKRLPTLRELNTQLYKYGTWPLSTVLITLPVVLLDSTESAQMENFMSDNDDGKKFKKLLFTNDRYRANMEQILPWLHNRGLLESYKMPFEEKPIVVVAAAVEKTSTIPEWITEEYFVDVLKQNVKDFKEIKKFVVAPGTNPGDNYASIMLKTDIDVELEDGSLQSLSYMLKVAPKGEKTNAFLTNTFKKEADVYSSYIPQFEKFYKDVGVDIVIGPTSFQFVKDTGCDTILLENLRPLGYSNADRLVGLDMEHTESILRKLAEFHAASAYYYATKCSYPNMYTDGVINEENREMMEEMGKSFYGVAYDNIKKYTGSEEYMDKLLAMQPFMTDISINAAKVNENSFNVLNHGDLWTNNVMFQYDDNGKIKNTYLIDFQMCKYGSPAQDLLYFLMTSPTIDLKIEHFDYFVRFYHENLTRNLNLLNYPKEIPTLKDLHKDILINNSWGFITVIGVMTAILLDPTENASIENMLGSDEAGMDFRNKMYLNQRYRKHAEALLPWLNRRGLLEFDEVKPTVKSVIKNSNQVPDWITEEYFIDILKKHVSNFKHITKFVVAPGTNVGDNYASLMLKTAIDFELEDGSAKSMSFMLKVSPVGEQSQAMLDGMSTFKKEAEMYQNIIPQFEQFYKDVGANIVFGPKSFEFVKDPGCETILLENLQPYGYKNADRLTGLDIEHTKEVLNKLSEFHAASAYYLATKGNYADMFSKGIFNKDNREMMQKMTKSFFGTFYDVARSYKGNSEYIDKIIEASPHIIDIYIKANEVEDNIFLNVLNHGDLWTNNIMFQYDAEGKIKNTFLIDYQMCQYGSPAQDLYYFLMSSPTLDIKVEQFDYFVRYYYENLTKNLELLKYPNKIPSLKELHLELFRNGVWGYSTVVGVMCAILVDPTKDASMENMLADDESGITFKTNMYSNQRYRSHVEVLLPWLNRRGLLDFCTENYVKESPLYNPPEWVDEAHFTDILAENIDGFSKILKLNASPATQAGDNYASILLTVDVEVELKDGATKSVSYMLKIPTASEFTTNMTTLFNFFEKEIIVYDQYLSEFEKMYKEAGIELTFGPKYYKFKKETGTENLLLENLRTRNFKCYDRLQGLDKNHTESVLRKLAQFHAASVKFVKNNGAYPEVFNDGFYCEKAKPVFEALSKSDDAILEAIPLYNGHEEYLHKMPHLLKTYLDRVIESNKIDPDEFNVLNHGDTWNNNIMFQYDDAGNIQETYFVDFQVCKYGSPAQDLYYLLISSTHLDIKVELFDYFINYYHQHLIENLTILKYSGKIPTLKELHASLLKFGCHGFSTLFGVTTVCLLEPTKEAAVDSFVAETPEAVAFRKKLYTNDRYKAHASVVLSWLNKRGLLDF